MLTGNDLETKEAGRLFFRTPVVAHDPTIHALVERCELPDTNSRYCLILCEHSSSTSVVVEENNEVVGFPTAYVPPEHQDTLFVWQVAVDVRLRGQGAAKKMLRYLPSRHNMKRIRYAEATVNPSNKASRSLSEDTCCAFNEELIFPANSFGNGTHEQENLIPVGPINPVGKTLIGR